jgi:hypothetical protein
MDVRNPRGSLEALRSFSAPNITRTETRETKGLTEANGKSHSVSVITRDQRDLAHYKRRLDEGFYIPPKILQQLQQEYGIDANLHSGKASLAQMMSKGESCFQTAKPANVDNLVSSTRNKGEKQAFPKSSLTRMLSGDVKPEWIVGLGRMESDKSTPASGYKDVFVSSLEEYQKKGINFDPTEANDPGNMAEKLDLKDDDLQKIKQQGAWLILLNPGTKLAIPSQRKNEWNPGYVEGGYTGSNQQEWVTPNVALDGAMRAGQAKIFKMDSEGVTTEWKFFQGKLLPKDEWKKAIDNHVTKVSQTNLGASVASSA